LPENDHDVVKDLFSILSKADAWRFNDIAKEMTLKRKRDKSPPVGRTTISKTLKEFVPLKLIEHDVITRKWRLTQLGVWYAKSGLEISEKLKRKLQTSSQFADFIQVNPATMMKDMITNFVRVLNNGPKPLPPSMFDQVGSQLERVGDGRMDAIAMVWMSEAMNLIHELSSLFAAILLFRSSLYPQNSDDVARESILKIAGAWFKLRTPIIVKRLADYLSGLEILTAMNKAVQAGKINEDLTEIPFHEIVKKLRRLGYLPR